MHAGCQPPCVGRFINASTGRVVRLVINPGHPTVVDSRGSAWRTAGRARATGQALLWIISDRPMAEMAHRVGRLGGSAAREPGAGQRVFGHASGRPPTAFANAAAEVPEFRRRRGAGRAHRQRWSPARASRPALPPGTGRDSSNCRGAFDALSRAPHLPPRPGGVGERRHTHRRRHGPGWAVLGEGAPVRRGQHRVVLLQDPGPPAPAHAA